MKLRMLILLTLCAYACAMVIRNKRNATEARYCAPTTPCVWDIYGTETHIVESTITNQYCQCDPTTSCEVYQDDTAGFIPAYKPPSKNATTRSPVLLASSGSLQPCLYRLYRTDSYGFADTHSVYSNPEGPLSSMITGIEGNELLRILSQQEPRVADTAPTPNYGSTAEMEDFWTNYRMNRSEMSANDDGSSVNNYFAEYNRGDGLPSGAWSDVNLNRQSSRQNDLMDSFDFLIKSLSSANNYVSMLTREQLAVLRAIRPSLLYELLQEVAKARSDRRIRRALPTECAFCKNNGENEECYTQHALKDWRGRVLCPVLRAFHCPRCGATGDRAHTIKYCPEPDLGGSSLGSRRRMTPSTSLLLGEPSGTTRPLSTPAAPSTTPVSSPVNGNLPYSTLWSNFNNFDKK